MFLALMKKNNNKSQILLKVYSNSNSNINSINNININDAYIYMNSK